MNPLAECQVQFNSTRDEMTLIALIVDRYQCMYPKSKYRGSDMGMDLDAVHSNGCPMNFQKLLDADDFNFMHDVAGICQHINRETGKLENFFSPRCHA